MLDAIMAQCRNTSLIMGVIALVGLLLQKKSATDVMSGTMKTVIGFMVFNIGSNAMSACVTTSRNCSTPLSVSKALPLRWRSLPALRLRPTEQKWLW